MAKYRVETISAQTDKKKHLHEKTLNLVQKKLQSFCRLVKATLVYKGGDFFHFCTIRFAYKQQNCSIQLQKIITLKFQALAEEI